MLTRRVAALTGSPWAFAGACGLILIWLACGPLAGFSEGWQLAINSSTTILTFLLMFVVQSSQNTDTEALQAKLDELLRALPEAHNDLIGIENS